MLQTETFSLIRSRSPVMSLVTASSCRALPVAPAEKTATCDPSGAFSGTFGPSVHLPGTHACALQRSGVWATHACEESRETTKAQDYRRVYARKRLTTFSWMDECSEVSWSSSLLCRSRQSELGMHQALFAKTSHNATKNRC